MHNCGRWAAAVAEGSGGTTMVLMVLATVRGTMTVIATTITKAMTGVAAAMMMVKWTVMAVKDFIRIKAFFHFSAILTA